MYSSIGENMPKSHEVDHGWKRFCESHKISATFHQLRHSFATTCRNAGIDPKVVQEMMGHSSYIVTDGYTHVREEMLKKVRESLKEAL
jgi:site-specific recombinase XerD